jgi:hypothetical protein
MCQKSAGHIYTIAEVYNHIEVNFTLTFNEAVSCYDCIASVIDKWINVHHWWSVLTVDTEKPVPVPFVHLFPHIEWLGFELRLLWWQANN